MEFEESCKLILCVLLTQYGKTFTTIARIAAELTQDVELGRSIHIVFTMNTLLNNKQFAKRLDTIEDMFGKGSVCIFASEYTGKTYTHVRSRSELQGLCFDIKTCPLVIVMCSNTRRYDDGFQFLKLIDANKTNFVRAFAYYDELHKYITDLVRAQIEEINSLKIVKGIVALTATPDKIWKDSGFWSRLPLIKLDNFNDSDYAGFNDMVYNCIDDSIKIPEDIQKSRLLGDCDKQVVAFAEYVLEKNPGIIRPGSRTFIPGHNRRASHNYIRDAVFKINDQAVAVVLNGIEKNLKFKNDSGSFETVPLIDGDSEVCQVISKRIKHYKLENRPLVITGFLCVGMGQTLTCSSLGSFTSAIFGHMDLTNDEIYQLFGRITGRMKGWGDKYVETQVYCPTVIMHRCNVMEQCARNMAVENNGSLVTRKDYLDHMDTMGPIGKVAKDNIRLDKKLAPVRVRNTNDATSVPYIITLSKEEYSSLRLVKGAWDKESINSLIKFHNPSLAETISSMSFYCALRPVAKVLYKRLVLKSAEASETNTRWFWRGEEEKDHHNDSYKVYIDHLNPRMIVSIYWGSKNAPTSSPPVEP